MIQKKTWILLIIFIFVILLAVFIDKTPSITSGLRTQTPTPFQKLLPGWSIEDLKSLDLSDDKGQIIIGINKIDGKTWELASVEKQEIDQGKVQNLLSSIVSLEIWNTFNPSSTLEQYGLLPSTRIITLHNTQDEKTLIKIGNQTTTGSGYYVQIDDKLPVVISKYAIEGILQLFSKDALILQTSTLQPIVGTQPSP